MTTSTLGLPISATVEPASTEELGEIIRDAGERQEAIYPVGGGTSLGFGLPAKRQGIAVSTSRLSQIVDYPAGDMTITVQAGLTMSTLNDQLRAEGQQLPFDVPHLDKATIGGVLATNANGPRRFGFGTVRDYVIGIRAVDGCGRSFSGGGRVVKNVAGYDFCKMLVGSLGTLGVITEVTLKVKPQPAGRQIIVGQPNDLDHAERILAAMVQSQTYPTALELVGGHNWQNETGLNGQADRDWLIAIIEGTNEEVDWMADQLRKEWLSLNMAHVDILSAAAQETLFQQLVDFPADTTAALVLKANVVPSGTTAVIKAAREVASAGETACSIQAHAGNGIVHLRFAEFPSQGMSQMMTGNLRPVAAKHRGNVVVMSNPSGQEMTRHSAWGGIDEPFWMMDRIKEKFDPLDLLNPGRYIYS